MPFALGEAKMKLVDILARELNDWPFEATHAYSSGTLARFSDDLKTIEPYNVLSQEPEDSGYAIVTRSQWQAAVDALKAKGKAGPAIDWSKAPEDATHFSPDHEGFIEL